MKFLISRGQTVTLLFIVLFFFTWSGSYAQTLSTDYEGSLRSDSKVIPVSKSRLAWMSADENGTHCSVYDSSSGEVWKKYFKDPRSDWSYNYFLGSADGNDLWVINAYEPGKKSVKEFTVRWIDAATGESKEKTYPESEFGVMHSTWANNKYLFILTTGVPVYDTEIGTKANLTLFRIDKSTMEMTKPDHEMDKDQVFTNVFWEILRVENDFAEGYMVISAGNAIALKWGRFDNEGKKISTSETAFKIKSANHFTRQIHGYCTPGAGVGQPDHNYYFYSIGQNYGIMLVNPMAGVQVAYNQQAKTYWVTGVIGEGEQKKVATPYDGFFLAKLNADFKVESHEEFTNQPLLNGDKNFKIHATPDGHHIHCYFDLTGNPTVVIGGAENTYHFIVDQGTLRVKNSYKVEPTNTETYGSVLNVGTEWLVTDKDCEKLHNGLNSFSYLVSGGYQYGVRLARSGKVTVITKKAR